MSFIRGGLVVVVSVVLFFCLLGMNGFWMMSNSLEYENVHSELSSSISELVQEQNIDDSISGQTNLVKEYCEPHDQATYSFNGKNIAVPCSTIIQGQNQTYTYISGVNNEFENLSQEDFELLQDYCSEKEEYVLELDEEFLESSEVTIDCNRTDNASEIISSGIENLVEDAYYKEYECEGVTDCFKDGEFLALASEQSKEDFESKFYWLLGLNLILIASLLFLVENKTNHPILIGSLVLVAALPFAKLESLVNWIIQWEFLQFLGFFFTSAYSIFWTGLVIGLILIAIGIVLKVFNLGFKINEFFDKFKKK